MTAEAKIYLARCGWRVTVERPLTLSHSDGSTVRGATLKIVVDYLNQFAGNNEKISTA
jgi:hypothetical protein